MGEVGKSKHAWSGSTVTSVSNLSRNGHIKSPDPMIPVGGQGTLSAGCVISALDCVSAAMPPVHSSVFHGG